MYAAYPIPRLSVWPHPVNGKNCWCTRNDALLTGPPTAYEEREHKRRVKPVCGAARIVQLLGGQCNITTAAVCHHSSRYFLFRSSPRRRRCERRKRRMCFYKPVRAFYIRVCIEGREKKKEKNECKLFEHEMQRTNVFLPFIYIPQVLTTIYR